MRITKINVEIKAVKNYQTFSLGAEIEAEEPVNMELLSQIEAKLMNEAVDQLSILCDKIGPTNTTEKPKVEAKIFTNNQQNNVPQQNQYQNNNQQQYHQQYQSVPCSPKQAEILRKYGLDPNNFDSKSGGLKIKELREAGGRY